MTIEDVEFMASNMIAAYSKLYNEGLIERLDLRNLEFHMTEELVLQATAFNEDGRAVVFGISEDGINFQARVIHLVNPANLSTLRGTA